MRRVNDLLRSRCDYFVCACTRCYPHEKLIHARVSTMLLEQINSTRGLGFDDWDLDFYEVLFKEKLKRDPTDVELFDMGQVRVGPGLIREEERGGGRAVGESFPDEHPKHNLTYSTCK